MRVLCAPMEIQLGHPDKNATTALLILNSNPNVQYVIFPPLFLSGCTCQSLFDYNFFINEQNKQLQRIISSMPSDVRAVSTIMEDGVEVPIIFDSKGKLGAIREINVTTSIEGLKEHKTNFLCLKHKWRIGCIEELLVDLKGKTTYFTCSGKGESSAKDVYSGACGGVFNEIASVRQFEKIEISSKIGYEIRIKKPNIYSDPMYPFVPMETKYLDEAIDILTYALRRRLNHMGSDKVVIGVSGGLDSTLATLICHNAIHNKKDIIGITMPGFGTSTGTKTNANRLMCRLNITSRIIPITDAVKVHFKDIDHDENTFDVTYENAQARERMQILFDYSNKVGGINIGTGDLSEAILGFSTFGGDHLSMYNVNIGVPKTLVRALVLRFSQRLPDMAAVLTDIAKTPISPELIPQKQETEAIIGSYKSNDFAIYHTVVRRLSRDDLGRLLQLVEMPFDLDSFYNRITSSQFKRNCSPDGVGVSRCTVDDFFIPSDIKDVF